MEYSRIYSTYNKRKNTRSSKVCDYEYIFSGEGDFISGENDTSIEALERTDKEYKLKKRTTYIYGGETTNVLIDKYAIAWTVGRPYNLKISLNYN